MTKKKKNINKLIILKRKIIIFFIIFFGFVSLVYATDIIQDYIKTQTVSSTWTNNNHITVSRIKTTYYINVDEDTILTNDQLRWFYYDNIFWYFRLDWSDDLNKNVHISSSSSQVIWSCSKAWKFAWKAYSKYVWFIDFQYNSSHFVYYCEDDNKLYWKAYSKNLGSQVFDWIHIRQVIKTPVQEINDIPDFSNEDNEIKENTIDTTIKNYKDWNIWWWDWYEIEKSDLQTDFPDENTFWIIK